MSFKLINKPPYFEITPGLAVKSYRALLNQTGTADPIAIVLQNTFGTDIIWQRMGVGEYHALLNNVPTGGGFINNKTWVQVSQAGPFLLMATQLNPEQDVVLSGYTAGGAAADGLDNVSIHIIAFT